MPVADCRGASSRPPFVPHLMLLPWHEDGDDGDGNDGDNNKMTMKTHSNTQLGCAYGATPSDFYYALNSVGSWPVNSFAIIIIIIIINKGLGILL